ncbi:MAG: metalloregulator ArsR/SmtB family transcription factor [Pseudomonadota bacterium]
MLDVGQFFDILADPTRRRILLLLLKARERCVCEIFQMLEMPQPKVSRHLAVMRAAGVLAARRDGTWVYYRLHPQFPLWAARIIDAMAEGMDGDAVVAVVDNPAGGACRA